jgi:hypothetical protein
VRCRASHGGWRRANRDAFEPGAPLGGVELAFAFEAGLLEEPSRVRRRSTHSALVHRADANALRTRVLAGKERLETVGNALELDADSAAEAELRIARIRPGNGPAERDFGLTHEKISVDLGAREKHLRQLSLKAATRDVSGKRGEATAE